MRNTPWIFLAVFVVQAAVVRSLPLNSSLPIDSSSTSPKSQQQIKSSGATAEVLPTPALSFNKYHESLLNHTLLPFLNNCTNSASVQTMCNAYFDAVETLNATKSKDFDTSAKVQEFLDKPAKEADEFCRNFAAALPKEPKFKVNLVNFNSMMSKISQCSRHCFSLDDDKLEHPLAVCRMIAAVYLKAANESSIGSAVIASSASEVSSPHEVVSAKDENKAVSDDKPATSLTDVKTPENKASTTVGEKSKETNPDKTSAVVSAISSAVESLPVPDGVVNTDTAKSSVAARPSPAIEPAAVAKPDESIPDAKIPDSMANAAMGNEDDYVNTEPAPLINNEDIDDDDDEIIKAESHPGDSKYTDDIKIERHPGDTAKDPFIGEEDSSFFSYFMFILVLIMAAYVVYHNRRMVLALLLEGRRRGGSGDYGSGRRKHTAAYRKLDTNLEEAIASPKGGTTRSQPVIY